MKQVWAWLRGRWQWLLLGLTVLFGGLFFRERRILGMVRDELAVMRAKKEIARLEGERKMIEAQVAGSDERIADIDDRILERKIEVVRAYEGGEELRGAELDKAFKELGL